MKEHKHTPSPSRSTNTAYSYDVAATDPHVGDTLTYAFPTALISLTINATMGLIAWALPTLISTTVSRVLVSYELLRSLAASATPIQVISEQQHYVSGHSFSFQLLRRNLVTSNADPTHRAIARTLQEEDDMKKSYKKMLQERRKRERKRNQGSLRPAAGIPHDPATDQHQPPSTDRLCERRGPSVGRCYEHCPGGSVAHAELHNMWSNGDRRRSNKRGMESGVYRAPSQPYVWADNSRVTIRHTGPCYWHRHLG